MNNVLLINIGHRGLLLGGGDGDAVADGGEDEEHAEGVDEREQLAPRAVRGHAAQLEGQ